MWGAGVVAVALLSGGIVAFAAFWPVALPAAEFARIAANPNGIYDQPDARLRRNYAVSSTTRKVVPLSLFQSGGY